MNNQINTVVYDTRVSAGVRLSDLFDSCARAGQERLPSSLSNPYRLMGSRPCSSRKVFMAEV